MKYDIFRDRLEVIIKYNGNIETLEENDDMLVEVLSNKFAIVNLYREEIKLLKKNKNIMYIEPARRIIRLEDSMDSWEDTFLIEKLNFKKSLEKEVIFGVIDSDINYMDTVFYSKNKIIKNSKFIAYSLNKSLQHSVIMTTEFIRGVKKLLQERRKIGLPMVIITGFDIINSLGIENSLFLECIESLINIDNVPIVTPGYGFNEENLYNHGRLKDRNRNKVEFNINSEEQAIILELYKNRFDSIGVELVSPKGEATGKINIEKDFTKLEGKDNECYVCLKDDYMDCSLQHIFIILISKKDNLECGKWRMFIDGEKVVDGQYYLSLFQEQGVYQDIKFIKNKIFKNNLQKFRALSNIISVESINKLSINNKDLPTLSIIQVASLVALIMEEEISSERLKKYLFKIIKGYGERKTKNKKIHKKNNSIGLRDTTALKNKLLDNVME